MMDASPWLPSFTAPKTVSFIEGTNTGSKYVEIVNEASVPLHSLATSLAAPFKQELVCAKGFKTVDGTCKTGYELPGAPFWKSSSRMTLQVEPYEILPKR
jgi:hypothetical protein